MDAHIVFYRTDKGADELKTRQHGLSQKQRLALILVDGESDIDALKHKSPTDEGLEQILESLAMNGYIAANAGAWVARSPDAETADGSTESEQVARAKDELVDLAILVLGDQADRVVKKIKSSADNKAALLDTLQTCRKLVGLFIDEAKADELQGKCQAILAEL